MLLYCSAVMKPDLSPLTMSVLLAVCPLSQTFPPPSFLITAVWQPTPVTRGGGRPPDVQDPSVEQLDSAAKDLRTNTCTNMRTTTQQMCTVTGPAALKVFECPSFSFPLKEVK